MKCGEEAIQPVPFFFPLLLLRPLLFLLLPLSSHAHVIFHFHPCGFNISLPILAVKSDVKGGNGNEMASSRRLPNLE
ncbi:hypothetical protein LZ30DRAFT_714000 [Colletotrichum cereale]|nr:hypothetical protein LZ30DRAFT_714000 [Colletotrichum cereale]